MKNEKDFKAALGAYKQKFRLKFGAWQPSGLSVKELAVKRLCLN